MPIKYNMPYKILQHIADLKIRITAPTAEELFREAVRGMMEVMRETKDQDRKPEIQRIVEIKSPDATSLLIDFLNEVLSSAQINKEIYIKVNFKKFSETALEAELIGQKVDEFDEDVKAVTYHEADVKQGSDGQWQTLIILDI